VAGDVPTWPPAEQLSAVWRTYTVRLGGRYGAAMLQQNPEGWRWALSLVGGPSMQGGPFSTPADAERAMVCSGMTITGRHDACAREHPAMMPEVVRVLRGLLADGVGTVDALQIIIDALDPLDARMRGVVVEGSGLDVGACVVPLVPDGPNMGRRFARGVGRRASIIGAVEDRAVVVRAVVWGGAG